ncbi:urease accessory protein UreF [Paenibacillus cellulositrophicus]|uniref:urease accessory protein UreF n=1 Tax=Paenibacillus cellulositrophicus TaxID=562959 RepID=UPI00203B086C|nr:urease accessory protein UreF [Paenibacillus cellulositrophicus]MCM3000409.1 urease accessory protein UreF [Paenibacillus cellulositrophicus]
MDKSMLSLLQLCDSNFPTGAFSHSFGLESYIQEGLVHDPATFANWLGVYLNQQLVHADGLASRCVFDAVQGNRPDEVWKWDRLLTVQNLARETREGTQKMGDRMLALIESMYSFPLLSQYRQRIRSKASFGHPAVVFTMTGHHLGASREDTLVFYLYSVVVGLVQNAVRAIPLGQTAGQQIIRDVQEALPAAVDRILALDEEDFGVLSPGIELSQMKHERVNIRIFMS